MTTGQYDLGSPSIDVPSSWVTLGCVQLTITITPHSRCEERKLYRVHVYKVTRPGLVAEAGESRAQGLPGLQLEFTAHLNNSVRARFQMTAVR